LGFSFGESRNNASNVPSNMDDNKCEFLLSENNDMGALFATWANSLISKATFQHSKYENLIITESGNLKFSLIYSEADQKFVSFNSENYPLNYIQGYGIEINAFVPIGSLGWFRAFEVDARSVVMTLCGHYKLASALENPTHTGDFAPIKMLTNFGQSSLRLRLFNYSNLQTKSTIQQSVINTSYSFPTDRCYVEAFDWSTGNPLTAGRTMNYDYYRLYSGTNGNPSVQIQPEGLFLGDGTNAVDVSLRRDSAGVLQSYGSHKINNQLILMPKGGVPWQIWMDNAGNIKRKSNAAPTDKETDGNFVNAAITSISATPSFVGQLAVVGGVGYMAVGTSSTADWKQITN
jgi:hypothetical protein